MGAMMKEFNEEARARNEAQTKCILEQLKELQDMQVDLRTAPENRDFVGFREIIYRYSTTCLTASWSLTGFCFFNSHVAAFAMCADILHSRTLTLLCLSTAQGAGTCRGPPNQLSRPRWLWHRDQKIILRPDGKLQ
jgi:hypothetical protein